MFSVVEPTWLPSKESTGTVASSAWIVAAAAPRSLGRRWGCEKRRFLEEGFEEERKMEEEKKDIGESDAIAIVVERERRKCYPIILC